MVAMAPVLFCQGKYVRLVTPKLPEAAGPRSGECGRGAPLGDQARDANRREMTLLVLGDSAAAGVGVATQDQALVGHMVARLKDRFRVRWRVIAETGATTRSTIVKLKQLHANANSSAPPESFSLVAISLGVNEVTCGRSARKWLAELDELARLLRDQAGVQRMLWSGIPAMHEFPCLPQPLRWYLGARARMLNRVLRAWTERQPDCEFVAAPDGGYAELMATDGFHPGPKVYELWAEEMVRRVEKIGNGRRFRRAGPPGDAHSSPGNRRDRA